MAAFLGLGPGAALAQPQLNPVYVDDAPAAADALARVRDHIAANNLDEAVRVLQSLLDEQADRVTPSAGDPDVFVSVRSRVHEALLDNPPLLGRYRALVGPRAAAELESGATAAVERSLLLTSAGMEATLRIAQGLMEDGKFEAARLALDQLERHPDRLGADGAGDRAASLGKDAAGLLATLSGYIPRAEVRAMAERWAAESGSPLPEGFGRERAWPDRALCEGESPLGPLPELSTSGLISKPLWTVPIGPASPISLDLPLQMAGAAGRGQGSIPLHARVLEVLPTVCEDLLVINDGAVISAWDRFTLSPRWTVQPSGISQNRDDANDAERAFGLQRRAIWGAINGSDALTVTIRGRYGAVATGRNAGAGRDGDDRVHGLDARTGRVRWTRTLSDIDPGLSDSMVRGPLEIVEGVVILAARKHLPDRRLLSLTLVGLDADTGRTIWQRVIGSAGWLPFAAQSYGPEGTTIDRGIAYRSDRLGVVGAVECASGRAVWMRRIPADANNTGQTDPQAWEISRPIVHASAPRPSIIVVAPDQKRLVRLDQTTGQELESTPTGRILQGGPAYLLRAGEMIAAIPSASAGGASRIAFLPIDDLDAGEVSLTPLFDPPGIWGRVSVVGDKVLAPIVDGLALIDPARPGSRPLLQALDEPGNILALGRQLLVIDDSRAHSYLQWETAESILTERMAADPADPTPAVTFAELAYRAGRPERIEATVDAALAAIRRDPEAERNRTARARLIETLNAMINSGLEPMETRADAPAAAADPGRARTRGAIPPRIEDRRLLAALVERLGTAAQTPDDRVAVVLAGGRLAEQAGEDDPAQATRAAALYQQVFDDPQLAMANWRGSGVSIRGELEAARRLEQLIARFGATVYAAEEAEAARLLAEAGPDASVESLERLVGRFPLAATTPQAYLQLHAALKKGEEARSATTALELGLKTAQRVAGTPPGVIGELAGRLVTELRAKRQTEAAAGVLRNVQKRFAGVPLTVGGSPLDAQAIEGELAAAIAQSMRWPRIGQVTAEHVQTIQGWALMRPLLRDPRPHVAPCLAMESEREVAVFAPERGGGPLTQVWSRRVEDAGASLIKVSSDGAYILCRASRTGGVEKVALAPDAAGWKSESPAKIFPPNETTRGLNLAPGVLADQFDTPDDGIVLADDLLVAMDERTLVLVQRGGRIAALDTDTGELLWTGSTPVARVYDAQVSGGVLVVAGDSGRTDAAGALMDIEPAVQVVDARTGRLGQRIGGLDTRVRWVRVTGEGAIICGLENQVLSIDLASSQRNWTIDSVDVMPAAAAWVFGDRLLMMSPDRSLWLASVSTGRLNPKSLETPRSHTESTRDLDAFLTTGNVDGPFAVPTQQGIMIFGAEGQLQGVDGMGGIDTMLLPRAAEERAVAIETISEGRGESGLMQYRIHVMETGGGMLVDSRPVQLGARPMEAELLDGRIAVSAGAMTVVIEAPAPKK